ncbi:MAG TPA: VOC family protein, partial [Polyangiales bacterium]|nr:VOC family protein [Polyangiales bacterium]
YRDVMGFTALPKVEMSELGSQNRVRFGGHVLKLYDFRAAPEACEGGTDKAIGMRLLAFLFDDLEPVLARFDERKLPYRRLPLPEGSTLKVAFASDADGNALELVGLAKPAGERFTARVQVGLTVSDIERSRHFYGQLLGLREEPEMKLPKSMGVVGNVRYGFICGATTIKFWSRGELPVKTGAPARRTGIRLMTAAVSDVDATCAELRARGVTIKSEPQDFAGLARIAFIADPDGNWIELAGPLRSSTGG